MTEPLKKKYRLVYHRPDCIGAGACVTMHDKRWIMNSQDDKADLIGGTKISDQPEIWEVEFTEEELELFKESAYVCPVNVIHIIEVETGKKII